MHIKMLPLDAWTTIFRFLNCDDRLVDHFEVLCSANVFDITRKLDIFWYVTCDAKLYISKDSVRKEVICEKRYKECVDQLCEMGLNRLTSVRIAREAEGDLSFAFVMLGWI